VFQQLDFKPWGKLLIVLGGVALIGSLLTSVWYFSVMLSPEEAIKQVPAMLFGTSSILIGVSEIKREKKILNRVSGITGATLAIIALVLSILLY